MMKTITRLNDAGPMDTFSEDLEQRLKARVMAEFCYQVTPAKAAHGNNFIQKLVILTLRAMAAQDDIRRAEFAARIYAAVLEAPNCAEFMESPYAAPLFELLRHYGHERSLH